MYKRYSFLVVFIFILLAGCNQEQTTTNESEEAETEIESEELSNVKEETTEVEEQSEKENVIIGSPLPTTLEELEKLPSGYTKYINRLEEEGKKLTDVLTINLPDISNNPTTEELDRYYEAILSVFQQDFEGPGDLIEQLKFQTIGSPDIEDPRYQFKENLNVMVILDASGSMANYEGSVTRMDAAKKAITEFVKTLPGGANVGLRIYGHKGTGKDSDKALSCSSSELIYPLSNYNAANFEQALSKAVPAGWTPIGHALNEAKKDLASLKGDSNTNIVYLVSDGISTCDDDPVGAAKALYDSDITPIVNVIGFNVDQEGQKQLQEIATAVEGTYENVADAQGLQEQLNEANEIALKWKQWKTSEEGWINYYKTDNSLDIFSYHSKEFGKWVDERQAVGFTLTYLYQQKNKMSRESHDYLQKKNKEYHAWIEDEYGKLRDELKEINEMNHAEAIKALEEKYLTNTSTP
ncbi:vWA domain-containing protein [Lysinibacillus telephonicus]|uniref:VWA domain-containing protein n=1 Tax=Lysinibacillus telephonicus TaxID=1714840 RepID=A0A3S0QMJ3_9BACI|nr:VWA domain-containing protein [Lysinibacillus telephonicus]RTQ86279.1 VWA domain-containing protein [Lysinibacillus telephonicus]